MPLTDTDPNVSFSGRNSRSSTSNLSSNLKDGRRPSASNMPDHYSNAPIVLSMLKTTTETGDLGTFSIPQSRLPKIPRGHPHRPVAPSRTSSHYSRAVSVRSKTSNTSATDHSAPSIPGAWPSKQHAHGRSHDFQKPHLEGRSSATSEKRRKLSRSTSDQLNPSQRSFSLTQSLHPIHRLNDQRSIASLHSPSPREGSRPQYGHPTRLRRPEHRPASPAFSDTHGAPYNRGYMMRPSHSQHAPTASPLPSSFQPNHGYRNGTSQISSLRYHQPAGDSPRSFEGANRLNEPLHAAAMNVYETDGTTQMHQSYNMYNRTAQPFKPMPSPLRDGYSRFGTPHPIEQPAPQPAAYGGFVQRVKNILEERASVEDPYRGQRFSSPGKQANGPTVLSHGSQSPQVAKITRALVKAAVGSPSDKEFIAPSEYQESDLFQVQNDISSREGSSTPANGSIDLPRTTSTPDIVGMRGRARSEVETSASSAGIPSPAMKFSLRSAVQEATAPTMSDGSQSSTDLIELPAEPVDMSFEKSIHTKTPERPFSFPQIFEPRTDVLISNRQSLPASGELERRSPPDFSFVEFTGSGAMHSRPFSGAIVERLNTPLGNVPTMVSAQKEQIMPAAEESTNAPNSSLLLDYSRMQPRQSKVPEAVEPATPLADISSSVTRVSIEPTKIEVLPHPKQSSSSDGRISGASMNHPNRRISDRDSNTRGSVAFFEAKATSSHNSFDGSDLRSSALKTFNFPMPDLTEDSQEDASTTNLRMLGARHPMFRSGGFRSAQETRPRHRSSAAPEPPSSYLSRKLANTRGIPSLKFSSTDLTATLNRALGLRSSRSLEDIRHSRTKGFRNSTGKTTLSSTPRTLSQGDAMSMRRERYTSFFSVEDSSESEKEDAETEEVTEKSVPQEILAEIDRISIPSVNDLTVRLSELIPTIKRCNSEPDVTKSEMALESTLEEIRELGSPARLASMDLKRASIISTMSTNAVAANENENDAVPVAGERSPSQMATLRLMKALPPLPIDVTSPRESLASGPARSPPGEEILIEIYEGPAELEATVPVEAPNAVPPALVQEMPLPSPKQYELKKPSNLSPASALETRPWHQQANYPWSDGAHSMDIAMPTAARDDGSPLPRQMSRLKHSKSAAEFSVDEDIRIAWSMSPGPRADAILNPEAIVSHGPSKQIPSKKGPIGSLIRKIGIRHRVDKAGFPMDPHFLHPEGGAVTEPGDRYPTTGLTPPPGLNIEDNRSFFSDDSSDNEEQPIVQVRKRLTRSNQKRSVSRALTPGGRASDMPHGAGVSDTPRGGSALGQDDSVFGGSQADMTNPNVVTMMYDQPAAGMSKTEFRAKRMVEKFRTMWVRSGEFLRHLGHRKKQAPSWYETSELYAGT